MKSAGFSAAVLTVFCILSLMPFRVSAVTVKSDKANISYSTENSYGSYIKKYADKASDQKQTQVLIPADTYIQSNEAELKSYAKKAGSVAWVNQKGSVTWKLHIENSGFYNIALNYLPYEAGNNNIELSLAMDGKIPFNEAANLRLTRLWKDNGVIKTDKKGNDIRPIQTEVMEWQESAVKDSEGIYNEPFRFYFDKGDHTITLTSISEAFVLSQIKVYIPKEMVSYKTYLEENSNTPVYTGNSLIIEAENSNLKSASSLVAINDMSSSLTTPYSASKIKLNTFGGYNWKYAGQKASWIIKAPKTAMYKIAVRYRQNYAQGMFTHRRLYVNGETPFVEAKDLKFKYDINWQSAYLGDGYLIKLNAGENILSLEVTLGDSSDTLQTIQSSIFELNSLYRRIIMVTGTSPDKYRDYALETEIPGLVQALIDNAKLLDDLADKLIKKAGKRGSEAAQLQETARQLKDMAKKPASITKNERLDRFKANITSLGAWLSRLREQPLEIDTFYVTKENEKLPRGKSNLWEDMVHKYNRFIASFFEDYSVMSSEDGNQKVSVWIQTGRDQAQILKNMIDDSFTPKSGVHIQLELVQGSVIEATLAGRGPDVALNRSDSEPVNLAMRGALYALSEFSDYNEIANEFYKGSVLPYKYRDKYYALPERQSFDMLFYRKDVLDELKLKLPQTWDELIIDVLPVLQRNNMQIGIGNMNSIAETSASNIFTTLLYQNGGQLYRDDLMKTALDSKIAYDAFKRSVELYRDYKLPQEYDFMNRFRTGEMPVAVAPYTSYNLLTIGAPELSGMWDMTLIPGTRKTDGSIDRKQVMGGTAAIMFNNTKNKRAAWNFIKWWVSSETQALFGLNQEAVLGPSGRYDTANLNAFEQLPWSSAQSKLLSEQRKCCVTIPQLPGSYYTSRAINNAFVSSVINFKIPREELLYWNDQINLELERKRTEFGYSKTGVIK